MRRPGIKTGSSNKKKYVITKADGMDSEFHLHLHLIFGIGATTHGHLFLQSKAIRGVQN